MIFSKELQDDVRSGAITVSFRLWKRPKVKAGGRYPVGSGGVGGGQIEVDSIELIPFAAITEADVRQAGEPDRETLRRRAAHAGPIDDDTLLYRVEFHPV
ncbi:MAG TPA: ASCH domain-containing protein [Streptosporangiaceae bacterium]